jgi:hypothetical protein
MGRETKGLNIVDKLTETTIRKELMQNEENQRR